MTIFIQPGRARHCAAAVLCQPTFFDMPSTELPPQRESRTHHGRTALRTHHSKAWGGRKRSYRKLTASDQRMAGPDHGSPGNGLTGDGALSPDKAPRTDGARSSHRRWPLQIGDDPPQGSSSMTIFTMSCGNEVLPCIPPAPLDIFWHAAQLPTQRCPSPRCIRLVTRHSTRNSRCRAATSLRTAQQMTCLGDSGN